MITYSLYDIGLGTEAAGDKEHKYVRLLGTGRGICYFVLRKGNFFRQSISKSKMRSMKSI